MASEDRFSYEWQKYAKIESAHEQQFKKWIYPLEPDDFTGKTVLDAGCGNGRNSFWAIKYGVKGLSAFDHDLETVKVAKRNLKTFPQAKISFATIYQIPHKDKFDIVFSIGVVHHLEFPEKAILELVKAVKPEGTVLIWVYGYEGNELYVRLINILRIVTSRLPIGVVNIISLFPALLIFLYVRLPFVTHPYFEQLKSFSFAHTRSIIFDQLLPKIAKYYKRNEAEELLKGANLTNVRSYRVNNNSWTVIGKKSVSRN